MNPCYVGARTREAVEVEVVVLEAEVKTVHPRQLVVEGIVTCDYLSLSTSS